MAQDETIFYGLSQEKKISYSHFLLMMKYIFYYGVRQHRKEGTVPRRTTSSRPDGNSSYVNLLPALPDRGGSGSSNAAPNRFTGLRLPDCKQNADPVRLSPAFSIFCEFVPAFPVAQRICRTTGSIPA